jgi:hypothetical protein
MVLLISVSGRQESQIQPLYSEENLRSLVDHKRFALTVLEARSKVTHRLDSKLLFAEEEEDTFYVSKTCLNDGLSVFAFLLLVWWRWLTLSWDIR